MKTSQRLLVPALAAALIGGAALGAVTSTSVQAASEAPWQSASAKSPHAVGTVAFYDAAGHAVTSGDLDDPIAAYAVGTGGLRSGDTTASLAIYTPYATSGTPTSADSWSGTPVSASTLQSARPAFASGPTVDLTGSITLAEYLGGFANTVGEAAYQGVYELRLSTGAAGRAFSEAYNVVDLQVSGGQWHLYGEGVGEAVATSTTVAVTPAGAKVGQALTLSATVAPSAPGTVQFTVGGQNVGTPVEVAAGRASTRYTPTAAGALSIGAAFTPADPAAYVASTATAVRYTVATAISAACVKATTALTTATKALAAAKTALSKATTAKVSAYLKAAAKVTAAKAKVKAAKGSAAKKKASKALRTATSAATKAKKKAGSALTTYNRALATQKAKAAAVASATTAKKAACT